MNGGPGHRAANTFLLVGFAATLLASCSEEPDAPRARESATEIAPLPPGPGQRRAGLPPTGSRVLSGRVECESCEGEIQVIVYEIDPQTPSAELIRGIAWVRQPWRFDIDGLPDDAPLTIAARWDPGGKVIRGEPINGTRISRPLAMPEQTQPASDVLIDLGAAAEFAMPDAGGPPPGQGIAPPGDRPPPGQGIGPPGDRPPPADGVAERPSGPPLPQRPSQRPGDVAPQPHARHVDESFQPEPVSRRPLRTVSGKVVCETCGGGVVVFLSAVPTLDPQSSDIVDKTFIDSGRAFVFRGVPATRRVYLGARWDADGEAGPGLPGPDDLSTSIVITPLAPGEEAEPFEIVLKPQ